MNPKSKSKSKSLRKRKPTRNAEFRPQSQHNPHFQPQLQLQVPPHNPAPKLNPISNTTALSKDGMRNLFQNISAKVQSPNVSAKDLATLTLMLLAGGVSYKLLAEADAGVNSDTISQYHLTGRTDTTWGDKMSSFNASIPRTGGGKTRRRSRKY